MSILTDELGYIWDWLKALDFDFVDCYNPGLSRQQIDEIVKDLPFKLSDEIYELYQWWNGFAFDYNLAVKPFLFPEQLSNDVPITFGSLQDSVYDYKTILEATKGIDGYWDKKWFPIAAYECKRRLYVVGDLNPSPVYLWDVDCLNYTKRVYKNLTSMISVIAECCELGLYQLVPDEYGEKDDMIIRIDEEKLELEKEIYRRYNS
ncbi:SMI1/KNR4 family protein [Cronbergia sp. UHCC 0137]|uniref:SMI1/KNR4 family protein n=1 Tax=Cronbergia sp. UHCC 0137 TaxID=3110239 RepID=UPI002B211117|nr:SMI1/KNR4 family protein [Cronbergia sp. UHCC 0137]MEA5619587.1 SMI1/KNR4 family protein [Cronbergia sp. UHCC 0137]